MSPREALDELVANDWFEEREDGWAFAVDAPRPKGQKAARFRDLDYFISLVHVLSVWSVSTAGGPARVQITRGEGPDTLMWKVIG